MSLAQNGNTVQVHYTGKLANGEVFDSSVGRAPLEFTVGAGQMIKGFDTGVLGMAVGDKKTIVIAPEDGYGVWDENQLIEFPVENVPPDMKLEKGMQLNMQTPDGSPFPVVVHEVSEEKILLDGNHFLAGKELSFDVEMVTIK
jgi:peptidylprolyl isomerase